MIHFVFLRLRAFSISINQKTCHIHQKTSKRRESMRNVRTIEATIFKPPKSTLIKATSERLSMDSKGLLPTESQNRHVLTFLDEYSRFPFAIPCEDVSSKTVISSLIQIFSFFGLPSYVHSDRGSSFISQEIKNVLSQKGVATGRTTPYNPEGNGHCERFNGTIWDSVTLALE